MLKEFDIITDFLYKPEIPDFRKAKEYLKIVDKVGWDLDQTLFASEYPVIGAFNQGFNTNYNLGSVSWVNNITSWLIKDFGIDEKTARYINAKFWHDPALLSKAFPYPASLDLSLKLNNGPDKKEQFAVTSRLNTSPGMQKMVHLTTHMTMSKWFPWIPKENVFVDDLKGGPDYKINMLIYLNKTKGLNLFFEDYDSNAYKIVETIPDMRVILVSMESFLNPGFKEHPRIFRLPNMEAANALVAHS